MMRRHAHLPYTGGGGAIYVNMGVAGRVLEYHAAVEKRAKYISQDAGRRFFAVRLKTRESLGYQIDANKQTQARIGASGHQARQVSNVAKST